YRNGQVAGGGCGGGKHQRQICALWRQRRVRTVPRACRFAARARRSEVLMNTGNLPYDTGYADWDEEWEASLRGQHLGVYGRRIAEQLAGLVSGDTREIVVYPIVPVLRSGATRTVTSAWLTVKSKETGSDGSSTFDADGGKLQITTTNNPG